MPSRNLPFRTAQTDADTGRTTAGSVVITTRSGSNAWHGEGAFYDRSAALNARFPIDNPAPDPKQPFSRQNYVGTLGGPVLKDRLWFFASFEYVHENASIAYSPASLEQFDALAQLASMGLIPGVPSISVPNSVAVPFRDYLDSFRLDWAQSERTRWFLRAATDSYTTKNSLVEQGALPSTGSTAHNNYFSFVIGQQSTFSAAWSGSLVLNASLLHLTQTRNANLGFALAFPFTTTSSSTTGFETYGDNQYVTAITNFPILRNQEKYQVRYDASHVSGSHSTRFGVNLIHEPVLSGALTANAETLITFPEDPTYYLSHLSEFPVDYENGGVAKPAGDGSFSQNVQRLGFYAEDSWQIVPALTVNYGLRYTPPLACSSLPAATRVSIPHSRQGLSPASRTITVTRLPRAWALSRRSAPRTRRFVRAGTGLYYDDLGKRMGHGVSIGECREPAKWAPHSISDRSGLPHAVRVARHRRNPARIRSELARQRRLDARDGDARLSKLPVRRSEVFRSTTVRATRGWG